MLIYALKMLTPVRFGEDDYTSGLSNSRYTCHSDTLFSAVCTEWIMCYGKESLNELIGAVENDNFAISGLLPYQVEDDENKVEFYLPKPIIFFPVKTRHVLRQSMQDKKKMKKLKYIPVTKFDRYIECIRDRKDFQFEPVEFARETIGKKVTVARGEGDSTPYTVSNWSFYENTGLYFIAEIKDMNLRVKFERVLTSLGLTGIGGKRSSGYGKFEIMDGQSIEFDSESGLYESDELLGKIMARNAGKYMALSLVAPDNEDFEKLNKEDCFYSLVTRSGFIYSNNYAETSCKKRTVSMFSEGSLFSSAIRGSLIDVSNEGRHPVYRYGKGMYVGVKI